MRAVGAPNSILGIFLCRLSHFTNAESADVVFAASAHKDRIEVPQTNRTAVFELVVSFVSQVLYKLYLLFADVSPDAHFVSQSDLAKYFFLATVIKLLNVIPQGRQCLLKLKLKSLTGGYRVGCSAYT